MKKTSKEFTLKNKKIIITTTVDELDETKIFSNRYFVREVRGKRTEMISKTKKDEFYNDIKTQLDFLQNKNLTQQDFFDAFLYGCVNHIKKFGRLIITDMHSQLNYTMHILDASNNIFHNYINSEDEGIHIRDDYASACMEVLADYILVPHPFLRDENGMAKLVKLKEA